MHSEVLVVAYHARSMLLNGTRGMGQAPHRTFRVERGPFAPARNTQVLTADLTALPERNKMQGLFEGIDENRPPPAFT